MSEKSSAQERHNDDSSHSSYSNRQHNLSQPKNMHQQPQPQEMPRVRPEEFWGNQNFQFQSPGFGPFQIPQSIAQIQNISHFQLNKGDNLFEEYPDMGIQQDRRSNPIRKVSGPFENLMIPQEMNPMDDDPIQNAQSHQMIKPQTDRGQYMQGRFPQFQMPPVFKNPTGPLPNPYQNMGMMNPMMQVFPPQQFKQYQQYPHPYFSYMPYGIPMQREPEASHFTTISTVSKELQTKVYMISQQTTVSTFQCNCKKSKCLKLYCECFANGQVCSQNCNCMDCKNRIDNMQERQKAIEEALIRNNDAFNNILNGKQQIFPPNQQPHSPISIDPQSQFNQKTTYPIIQQTKDEKNQQNKNQNQANRARKGCNCKKSNCKKKYCECYSAQLACTEQCKCESCYNNKIGGNNEEEKPTGQHINNNIIINQQQNIIQIGQGSQIKMEDSSKKAKFEEQDQQNQQEHSEESNNDSESLQNANDALNDKAKEKLSKKLLKKSKKIKKEVDNEDNPSVRVLQVSYQSAM